MTTLSPVDKHADITLSPDLLTATYTGAGGAWRSARGTTSHSNGRYYFEATFGVIGASIGIGAANAAASLASYIGSDANGIFHNTGGQIHAGGALVLTTGITFTNGTTIGLYIDLDANYLRVNKASSPAAWSAFAGLAANLGTTIEVFPSASLFDPATDVTLNFGASGFVGAIPSYMQSWDLSQTGLYVPGWDPMHCNTGLTLSGSNLTATVAGSAGVRNVRAMEGLRNGPSANGIDKVYWEVNQTLYSGVAFLISAVGLCKSTVGVGTAAGDHITTHADAWAFVLDNPTPGAWHANVNTILTAADVAPGTVCIAWNRATGNVWMKALSHGAGATAGWAGGGNPETGTSPTFTLTGSEVYYPVATLRSSSDTATLVYSGFAGGLPADYVSIQDAVTDPDESPFPTPTPTPGGGGLPISEELAAYLGLPPKPAPPPVQLTNFDGTPTRAFHDYLTKQYEWERRLYTVLTE